MATPAKVDQFPIRKQKQIQIAKEIQKGVADVYQWLLRANFSTTRKFFLGIIHRIENLALLKQTIRILSSMKEKDFTYSRSQCNSSLLHYQKEFSSNKFSVKLRAIEIEISKAWSWFSSLNISNKSNFLYCIIMVIDDSTILHQALNLAKTVYVQQKREQNIFTVDDSLISEPDSLSNSTHSFHTDQHPDIYMLAEVNSCYELARPDMNKMQEDIKSESDLPSESSYSSSESSMDPRAIVVSASQQALSGVCPYTDFISKLPIHLAKKIISLLGLSTQRNAACVCQRWHTLVRQVQLESRTKREILEEAVMMQGVSAKGAHPNYAKKKIISVPLSQNVRLNDPLSSEEKFYQHRNSFGELEIAQYEMEERNVYCGSYNVLILDKHTDAHRVIHYSGGNVIASGSHDRIIRLFNSTDGHEILPPIRGHPGSITSLFVSDDGTGYIFSGSYDTTIRRWKLGSSSCQQIFHGHRKSVTNLDYSNHVLVSAANDGLIKVWNVKTGKCSCTFKHSKCSPVTCVKFLQNTIVSSCDRGLIKVWDISTRKLCKMLVGHSDAVSSVGMDDHYVVSGSHDGYVMTWLRNGNIRQHVNAYRHPKKVLCVELRYLRIVSGCEDGKIRVLHLHTGECLRVFESISWEYDLAADRASCEINDDDNKLEKVIGHCRPYVRAARNWASSISCSNLRNRPFSAPVKKQRPLSDKPRLVSSFSSLNSYRSQSAMSVAALHRQRGNSPHLNRSRIKISRVASESTINVHDSRAMSVISGISSMIIKDDLKEGSRLHQKWSTSSLGRHSPGYKAERTSLSRDRIHLKISSIHHNTRSEEEDINTALNGGHLDIREIFHEQFQKSL
ncbi:unnamed protein product [Clavelina lepadiformis]|uniref:F-box domain-containing protein n=1 Tax=Clavelina lepadiformis TaxID=159417 RepID=A0ABP0FGD9_CLALP